MDINLLTSLFIKGFAILGLLLMLVDIKPEVTHKYFLRVFVLAVFLLQVYEGLQL